MAAITSAAIGIGANAWNIASNIKQKNQAKSELNDYERQSLDNAYKNIQISTTGTDVMRDENNATTANILDSIQNMGSRGVFGALPKIQMQNTQVNQEIRNNLDSQIQKRDYAIADDNVAIRGIKEQRDNQNISALSSQINSANQGIQDGVYGAVSGLSSLANTMQAKKQAKLEEFANRDMETPLGLEAKGKTIDSSMKADTSGLEEYNKRNFRY